MKSCRAALALFLVAAQDPTPKDPPPDPFVVKVSDMVRSRWAALVCQAAGPKVKFEEAVAQAAKLEAAILEQSAEKLGLSVDEVLGAWGKRERKPHKITYGDGSWIVLGGQDGGLDSNVKGTPLLDYDDTHRRAPPSDPIPLGKALKTKEEWWAASTLGERAAYVEAELVRKSALVEKKEEAKKCSGCGGKGAMNVKRGGLPLVMLCHRCHGTKEDIVVVYE